MTSISIRFRKFFSKMKTFFQAIISNPKHTTNQLSISSKIFQRRFNRLPVFIKISLCSSLICSVLLYSSILLLFFYNSLKSESFLELGSCPACYGTKLCGDLKEAQYHLYGWSKVAAFDFIGDPQDFTLVKNNGHFVTAKRLASSKRREKLDEAICLKVSNNPNCDLHKQSINFYPLSGDDWVQRQMKGLSPMTACPTYRLATSIMDRYAEKMDAIQLSAAERMMMMYTLQISQEPILFQTFPRKDNWPFPHYEGACGRLVAYAAAGHPLGLYTEASWDIRARISLQVVDIALKLTENKLLYGIYFTAVGLSTFAVNPMDGEVLINDGRFFTVVDRWQIQQDKFQGWNEACVSIYQPHCERQVDTEDICVVNAPSSICRCHLADVNFYAICRFVLAPNEGLGILSSIPASVDQLYDLTGLIQTCSNPTNGEDRATTFSRIASSLRQELGMQAYTRKPDVVERPPQQNIF